MPAPGSVPPETVQTVEDSYRRCSQETFLPAFYSRFLASDPSIPPRFAGTDFSRQNKLLQHGIGLLFIYAKRRNPAILDRIADRHGPADLHIEPRLYQLFADTLIETVREFDPQCTPAIEEAWRAALAPGIAFMIARSGQAIETPADA